MRRENKRIVNELIKQYDAEHNTAGNASLINFVKSWIKNLVNIKVVVLEETKMASVETVDLTNSDAALLDMNNAVETPTSLEPFFETYRTPFEEIEDLEMKL